MFEEEQRITVDILEEVVANDFRCNPSDVTIINHSCSAGQFTLYRNDGNRRLRQLLSMSRTFGGPSSALG